MLCSKIHSGEWKRRTQVDSSEEPPMSYFKWIGEFKSAETFKCHLLETSK